MVLRLFQGAVVWALLLVLPVEAGLGHDRLLDSGEKKTKKIDNLIGHLEDPKPVAKNREEVEGLIKGYGLEAVPILIDHLDDRRPAGTEGAGPPGRCLNQPLFERVNPPDDCRNLEAQRQPVTVGERSRRLLYEILTPPFEYSPEQGRILWKTHGERPFVIKDWVQWWGNHQGRTLEELHAEVRKLNDRYWRRGWEKGPIEWK